MIAPYKTYPTGKLYLGDCLQIMQGIPDNSIDMILCDLPYGTTACSWDTIIPFEPLWEQYKWIAKDNAAIVLTASQPFTSKLVMSNLDWFKYEWIWGKEQGTNQMLKDISPLKIHENILVYGKERIKYYPKKQPTERHKYKRKGMVDKITNTNLKDYIYNNNGELYPTTIIYSKRELNNRYHPTQKPTALFRYLIETYTNKGDIVLDNCIGSGTTAVACIETDRVWIGVDTSEEYCNISDKRIKLAYELKQQQEMFK